MKLLRSSTLALAILGISTFGLAPRASAEDFDTADLFAKAVKSTVFVVEPLKGGYGRGSGSLISAEKKLVLTNYHVVSTSDIAYVQFPMFTKDGEIITTPKSYMENITLGKAIKGKVLYRDKSRDLALIEIERVPAGTQAIPLAKHSPRSGTSVWNIGSPAAVDQLFGITSGTVRTVGISDQLVGDASGRDVFRVKARMVTATNPTNPGDSGGPLVNKKGEQVAVTESGDPRAQQVNLFVDITEVRAFLNEKKITIKELSDEPDPKGHEPKKDLKKDSATPTTTPPKDSATTPPKKDAGTPPATTAPKDQSTGPPAPDEKAEKAAADLLHRAGVFANDPDNKEYYMGRLREIIKKYPGTVAAKEAQKKLDSLK